MNQENLDRLYARLKAINWQNPAKPRRMASGELLIQEFFRRTALWNRVLRNEVPRGWIFYDLTAVVKPEIAVDWQGFSKLYIPDHHTKTCCFFAYRWAAIEDTPEVQSYNLPHPYEPLLMACDGGIGFYREEGSIDIYYPNDFGHLWLNPKTYERDEPFVELDEAVLDRIDQQES